MKIPRLYVSRPCRAGGGILVAAIQGSMMTGAMIGGGPIDATGPLVAAIAVLAVGAIHTAFALRAPVTKAV